MKREELAEKYKNACAKECEKDLVEEYNKVMNSSTITDKKKDWIFHMIMDTLKFAQEI